MPDLLTPTRKPYAHELLLAEESWVDHPRLNGCICWWPLVKIRMSSVAGSCAIEDFSPLGIPGVTSGFFLSEILGHYGNGSGHPASAGWVRAKFNAGNTIYSAHNIYHNIGTSGDFTLCVLAEPHTSVASGTGICGSGAFNPGVYWNSTTGYIGSYDGGYQHTTTVAQLGTLYSIVLVRRSGTVYFYINGEAEGASYSSSSNILNAPVGVGRGGGTSGNFGYSYIYDFRMYKRALDDSEIASLWHEPWLEFAESSQAFMVPAVGGGPYSKTLTLAVGAGSALTPQAVFASGVAFAVTAAQSDAPQAVCSTAQSLAVNTALAWAGQLVATPGISVETGAGAAISTTAAMQVLLSLSADISASWIDSLDGLIEALTLSAGATATTDAAATFHALKTLSATVATIQAAQMTATPTATLAASVLVNLVDSLEGIVEMMALSAGAGLTGETLATFVGSLSLSLNTAIAAQANATMQGLISLGITATDAQAIALTVVEAMTLQLTAALSAADTLNPATLGKVLHLVGQSLATPTATGGTFTVPDAINPTLTT